MLPDRFQIDVAGRPAPQGSKRHVGGGRMVEMSKYVRAWRGDVYVSARARLVQSGGRRPLFDGPVTLFVTFTLARPKSHYRTGKYAHLLKADAPAYPVTVPDLSKLVRATEDALTEAGVWADDSRVVETLSAKVYVGEPSALSVPGARITVMAKAVTS